MSDLVRMAAFQDELEKIAAPAAVRALGQRLLHAGSGAGIGLMAGGALGAGVGGTEGYQEARKGGATRGQALAGSVGKGLHGAMLGGTLGAAGGGLAAGLSGRAGAELAKRTTAMSGPVGAFSRFGQRQVHSLTGALPEGYGSGEGALRALRTGATQAEAAVPKAQQAMSAAWEATGEKAPGEVSRAAKHLYESNAALRHARKAEELGMTSAPGFFKAMVTHPIEATRAGIGQHPGMTGKALMLGLPAAGVAGEALKPSAPSDDKSRLHRTLGAAGAATSMALGPMTLAGGMLASGASSAAGNLLGKGMDKVTRRKPLGTNPGAPVPEEAPSSGNIERIHSPAALGKAPEGLVT